MNAARDQYLSTAPLSICLFLLFLTFRPSKPGLASRLGEKDSLYLYIFHPLLITFFGIAMKFLPAPVPEAYAWLSPFVVIVATLLFIRGLRLARVLR